MENSNLAILPPELRNRIYELVFEEDRAAGAIKKPVYIVPVSAPASSFKQDSDTKSRTLPIALTQTCGAIRQESSQMFYASLTLSFQAEPNSQGGYIWPSVIARNFLESLSPEHAAAVRHVALGAPNNVGIVGNAPSWGTTECDQEATCRLRARIRASRKWVKRLQALTSKCEVCVEVLFREFWGEYEVSCWFWLKGDKILWERTLESFETGVAMTEAVGLGREVNLCQWVKGLVVRFRDECEQAT